MNAGVNLQDGMPWPADLAVMYVCPDWKKDPPPGADLYRMMNRSDYGLLAAGSNVVVGNEDDDDPALDQDLQIQPPDVIAAYLARYGDMALASAWWNWDHINELRKAWRLPLYTAMAQAGYVVHCAAEKPTERDKYATLTMALCAVIDVHVGVPEIAGKTDAELAAWWTAIDALAPRKPKWCTEVQADPAVPEQLQQIPDVMARLLQLGFVKVFAWGNDPQRANVNDDPSLLQAIRAVHATADPVQPITQPERNAMPTDTQFLDLLKGLDEFTVHFEAGDLRGAGAALRVYLDAIQPNDQIQPPSVQVLPSFMAPVAPATPAAFDPAAAILDAAGLPASSHDLMAAWIQAEGGLDHNNPLNITAPSAGTWQYVGQTGFFNNLGVVGVATFDTMENGCKACAGGINWPNMTAIKAALAGGDKATFMLALRQDPWGTSADTVAALLGA